MNTFRAMSWFAILLISSSNELERSFAANPTGVGVNQPMPERLVMIAAFIRRVAQDVKKEGYTLIFTDVGPDSLERDAPDLFRLLVKRASGGDVQVRGFSQATKDKAGVFRDKTTAEKGVGLWTKGFKPNGPDRFIITGTWRESDEKWHDVKYEMIQTGKEWKAQ